MSPEKPLSVSRAPAMDGRSKFAAGPEKSKALSWAAGGSEKRERPSREASCCTETCNVNSRSRKGLPEVVAYTLPPRPLVLSGLAADRPEWRSFLDTEICIWALWTCGGARAAAQANRFISTFIFKKTLGPYFHNLHLVLHQSATPSPSSFLSATLSS